MGHDDGFSHSQQGPLAVRFITFGKNNANLAWRARSDHLFGGGVYSGTGSLGRICFAQAGVCVKVTSKRIRHRTLCCIPKAVSRRVRLD